MSKKKDLKSKRRDARFDEADATDSSRGTRTVLHWLSQDSVQLLMFCPGCSKPQYRNIVNQSTYLKDVAWIASAVPPALAHALQQTARRAIASLNKGVKIQGMLIMPWGIYADDNLADVRQKLAFAALLPTQQESPATKELSAQVYAWCTTVTAPANATVSSPLCVDAVRHAFRDRPVIPKSELLSFASTQLHRLHALDPSKERDELLTQWQGYKLLMHTLTTTEGTLTTSRPLDFVTKFDGYDVRMPTVPFVKKNAAPQVDGNMVMGDGTPRYLYTVSHLEGHVLATVAPRDSQIHVCTAASVMLNVQDSARSDNRSHRYLLNGYVRKYFPFMAESAALIKHPMHLDDYRLRQSVEHAVFATISRREKDVIALSQRSASARKNDARVQETALSYLQIRVNERNINGRADLRSVFDAFHVSQSVPMVIFYDGDTTLYRIDAGGVRSGIVPDSKIASWIQRKPVQRPDEPYLQFIVRLQPPHDKLYSKVIMHHDLSYEIRQHLPVILSADVDVVHSLVGQISGTVIRTMHAMFSGRLTSLPSPDTDFLQHHHSQTDTRLVNCVTTTVYQTPAVLPSLAVIERTVSNTFLHAHFVVVARYPTSLVLKYRRTDAPTRQLSVNDVIRSMRDMPKDEIVMQIQDSFGMDAATAIAQVEDWFLEASLEKDFNRGGQAGYLFSRGFTESMRPILVRIARPHKISGCTVVIEGLTNVDLIAQVRTSVQVLLSVAMTPLDEAVATKSDIPEDETPANIDLTHELEDDGDLKALFDAEINAMLQDDMKNVGAVEKTAISSPAVDDEHGDDTKSNKIILNRLYRADPALFQAKLAAGARYSRVCVKSDARQPIVITQEEKMKIDKVSPGSYKGFVHAGSTPELAQKNVYICPYVWCPKNRISMSEEQFNKNGRKCPKSTDAEEDVPIVLDAKYWQGRQRHPGLLEARHHPQGLCMPCCFAKPNRVSGECALTAGVSGAAVNSDTSLGTASLGTASPAAEESNRYIRGDIYPLGRDVFGILPIVASKFMGNTQCGNRDDGSGQIVASTRCFVRRGLPATNQPFLEALSHVIGTGKTIADSTARTHDMIRRITEALTMSVFMSVQDGDLCRRFMPASPPIHDADAVTRFAKWIVRGGPTSSSSRQLFLAASSHVNVSRRPKDNEQQFVTFLEKTPTACMEFVIFCAWHGFLQYLQDDQAVKTHHMILDIFNGAAGTQLNPRGANLIVLERHTDTGHVYGYTTPPDSMRADASFVVLVKTQAFYEPLYRVTMHNGKAQAIMYFAYDSSAALRSIIDNIYTRGNGSILHVLRILGHSAKSQIVDSRFRCTALVTESGVAVPLLPPGPVHPHLKSLLNLWDVHALHPAIATDQVMALFARISAMTGEPGYKVARIENVSGKRPRAKQQTSRTAALVLVCGFVVPIDIRPEDAKWNAERRMYLQNLNVFVGVQRKDPRSLAIAHERVEAESHSRAVQKITAALQADSSAMEEYRFLRSSFNPFPLDYRRAKMLDLIRDIGVAADKPGAITDTLLFGDDVLDDAKLITVAKWIKPQSESKFILFSDADIAQGALEAAVTNAVRQHTDSDIKLSTLLNTSADAAIIRTHMNNHTRLSSMNRSASSSQQPTASSYEIQSFVRRSRRMPWTLYIDIDVFTVTSMICRVTHAGTTPTANMMRSILKDRVMGLLHGAALAHQIAKTKATANGVLEAIESQTYRPGIADVEIIARACALNLTVFELNAHKKKKGATQRFVKHRFMYQDGASTDSGKRVLTSVLLMSHGAQGAQFDIVLNRHRGRILNFDDAQDLPEIERILNESTQVRSATATSKKSPKTSK